MNFIKKIAESKTFKALRYSFKVLRYLIVVILLVLILFKLDLLNKEFSNSEDNKLKYMSDVFKLCDTQLKDAKMLYNHFNTLLLSGLLDNKSKRRMVKRAKGNRNSRTP